MKERVILAIAFGFALGTAEAANEVVRPVYEPPCEGGPLERHHSCNQAYNGFIFSTSEGDVLFSFPVDDLRPGEQVSAAVTYAPVGKTEQERQSNTLKLRAMRIRWNTNGEPSPLQSSFFTTKVPEHATDKFYLELVDERNEPVPYPRNRTDIVGKLIADRAGKKQTLEIKPQPHDLPDVDYRGPGLFVLFEKLPGVTRWRYPRRPLRPAQVVFPILQPSSAVTRIKGSFHGDLSQTSVTFDGKLTRPLIETEDEILLDTPRDILGQHEIEVVEAGKRSHGTVQYFSIEATAASRPDAGNGAFPVRFHIRGLRGMRGQAKLLIEDLTSFHRYAKIHVQGAAGVARAPGAGPHLAAAVYSVPVPTTSISPDGTVDKDVEVSVSGSIHEVARKRINLDQRPLDPRLLKKLFIGSDAETDNIQSIRAPFEIDSPLLDADLIADETEEPIATVVTSAIVAWEADNGVRVTPDAQSFIINGFENRSADIEENIDEYDRVSWLLQGYISSLVRCYLYDVEARPSAREKGGPSTGQRLFDDAVPARRVIGYDDVHSYPVEQFLQLWWRLTKGNGWIEVDGSPSLFVFVDDKIQKRKTNTPVMLSFGEHTLEMSSDAGLKAVKCVLRVFVVPGPQQSYDCGSR